MFIALAILVVGLAVSVVIAMLLRSWVLTESETETRLHDPRTHTIAFPLPAGVDPVVFAIAVDRAGFPSVTDRIGDAECLVVECPESERAHLRTVLETVHVPQYDGSAGGDAHVVFQDER
jgi:hypothetical protein